MSINCLRASEASRSFLAHTKSSCQRTLREAHFVLSRAEDFHGVVSSLQKKPFLRKRSLEEYQDILQQGGQLFLMQESAVGYGIKSDGLLVSVFNDSDIPGLGAAAVRDAIAHGARSLLCVDGPLKSYYESFGFTVTDRIPMAPKNAGYDLNWPNGERPDMLYMTLTP